MDEDVLQSPVPPAHGDNAAVRRDREDLDDLRLPRVVRQALGHVIEDPPVADGTAQVIRQRLAGIAGAREAVIGGALHEQRAHRERGEQRRGYAEFEQQFSGQRHLARRPRHPFRHRVNRHRGQRELKQLASRRPQMLAREQVCHRSIAVRRRHQNLEWLRARRGAVRRQVGQVEGTRHLHALPCFVRRLDLDSQLLVVTHPRVAQRDGKAEPLASVRLRGLAHEREALHLDLAVLRIEKRPLQPGASVQRRGGLQFAVDQGAVAGGGIEVRRRGECRSGEREEEGGEHARLHELEFIHSS